MTEPAHESAVALVGMAGRFPGAADVEQLRRNLAAGVPGLRELTDAELADAGVDPGTPGHVRVGGPVAGGVETFDAAAFGLSAREAETLEPHHRLLLECSWEALERAGYRPTDPGVPVGLFAGCAYPDYLTHNLPGLAAEPGGKPLLSAGVERDSLTSLVSYKLGLRGPAITVQTYCSTSLVAVHLACQSLLTYECDLALAGGAALPLPQTGGHVHSDGDILSPDGRVRALDAAANGTVMGSGAAVVALKRLEDALADGDVVHAVILGSAVNNDGRDRAGYPAPGVAGQAAVVDTALAVAGVKPETVGYVECHAVGTPLGDSIELAALNRVFGAGRAAPCVLSSVKPSIGHLDRASGVTSLIRAALNLRDGVLPGTAGFRTPNPALGDRFTVLPADRPWPADGTPRRAGVSSFGVGGTNAHVVLEQPPSREPRPSSGLCLLAFSAGDAAALDEVTSRLRAHLASHPDSNLADVAFTLQVSRGHFALRRAVVCRDVPDAVVALADPGRWIDGETRRRDPRFRLVAGTGSGWAATAASVHRLLAGDDVPAPAPTRAGALSALTAGLTRLGIRLDESARDTIDVEGGSADEWVLATLARLWLAGCAVDWPALHRGAGRRVELPPYPFQRKRFWVDPASAPRSAAYVPSWRLDPQPVTGLERRVRAAGPWLVFAADPVGEALAERITLAGSEVTTVRPGPRFAALDTGDFVVGPGDLPALLRSLVVVPRTVVHGFALGGSPGDVEVAAGLWPGMVTLTSGAVGVLGPDLTTPEHASLTALTARHVDVGAAADVDQVLAAVLHRETSLAVRGDQSWRLHHEPCELTGHAEAEVHHDVPDLGGRRGILVVRPDAAGRALAAQARVARLAGRGRWTTVVSTSDPGPEVLAAVAAADHLTEVVLSGVPLVRPIQAGESVQTSASVRPRPALGTPFVEPEPGLEQEVAARWAAALGYDEIGADDNFFELGGRSAGAVRIAACWNLPATAVMELPTVRLLAAGIAELG
ncbi:beta-ketoacyl synthase N-terminal-like domain-containing protein [Amycolatopsis sp. A133]|uniref:beta-ketoacyl synthase N-terminal-like domain-containing protein n=1 Tax=Amycolatopsis sp. A133 TaxID=3064472 RepID=UPI0027FB95E3|nr:beta-ketoacyl synthase N-terminal-like domain-containing protein [Amycolatopsis sp. A133]MDQ7808718.1 beta-ketoacyl synthase N-terminal-like domain-containing protein [Amycolatopsis sp. A133]